MRTASLTDSAPEMIDEDAGRARLKRALDGFLRSVECRALRVAEISCAGRDDALDLVQDAMYGFVKSYSGKPPPEWPLLFWRVLDSRIVDFHRRRNVRLRWMPWSVSKRNDAEAESLLEAAKDEAEPGPLSRLGDSDALAALERALRQLPARQRQTFLLRVWHGMDVAQTAVAMQISEGSVKTHLFRALQQLRERLEGHHE